MSSLQWSALLSATLETWCHQVLYARQVYPRDTFKATRFLGIACFANRHPGVVSYISDTVQEAVPALLSKSVNQVSLVVMKDTFTISETFTLTLSNLAQVLEGEPQGLLEALERGMRELILSVKSLEGSPHTRLGDDASFKISMRTTTDVVTYCPEITKAIESGTWYRPNVDGSDQTQTGSVRPLHEISLPVCCLQMSLITDQ
jgi:hypothetical protein